MKIKKVIKESFFVMGKMGSTNDGEGFIKRLYTEFFENFDEIKEYAKLDNDGKVSGIWGIMSDLSLSFKPWQDNFQKGIYLVGVEIDNQNLDISGWTILHVPGYEYLCTEVDKPSTFRDMLKYLEENDYVLVGAVHEYHDFKEDKDYMCFPIKER